MRRDLHLKQSRYLCYTTALDGGEGEDTRGWQVRLCGHYAKPLGMELGRNLSAGQSETQGGNSMLAGVVRPLSR